MTATTAPSPLTLDLARGDGWKTVYERELDALDRLRMLRLLTESTLWSLLTFAGFLVVLLVTASLALPAGVAAVWSALSAAVQIPWLPPVLALLAAVLLPLILLVLATVFLSQIDTLRRKITEQEARVAFCEIARGKAKPYALCLRPADMAAPRPGFVVRLGRTARLLAAAPSLLVKTGGQAQLRRRQAHLFVDRSRPEHLDAAILNDLLPSMPVLVLGFSDGGTADLQGRLSKEDEAWNETVSLLLAGADRIFCQPDLSGGPVWELSRLKPLGLVRKTVFIMPPAARMEGHPDHFARTWDRIAQKAGSVGLGFPAWSPAGQFFLAGSPGSPVVSQPFALGEAGHFRHLHEALGEQVAVPAPTAAAPKTSATVSSSAPERRSSQLRQASPQ